MKLDKILTWAIVVAVIFGTAWLVGGNLHQPSTLGGTTNYDSLALGETLSVTGASTFTGGVSLKSGATFSGVFSTSTTSTLTQAQLTGISTINVNPASAAITLTLPDASTLTTLIPNSGDAITYLVTNQATTSTYSTTLVGGVGTVLGKASTTAIIEARGTGLLTLYRLASTSVEAFLGAQGR